MKKISLICILLLMLIGVGAKAAQAYQTYLPVVTSCLVGFWGECVPPFPTPTPIPPAPTPTPTPTQAPPVLIILSSQSYVQYGYYFIVGEVWNNTNVPMEYVKIVATLYDNNGYITGTGLTYTDLDVIAPGGKSPFETMTNPYVGTTNYKLQVQGREGTLGRQDLVISNSFYYVQYEYLFVVGEVKNTGTTPAEYVKPVVTLYDSNGNVVGTGLTYTDLTIIPPGGDSPFDIMINHFPNFDHYEIQVQGR